MQKLHLKDKKKKERMFSDIPKPKKNKEQVKNETYLGISKLKSKVQYSSKLFLKKRKREH